MNSTLLHRSLANLAAIREHRSQLTKHMLTEGFAEQARQELTLVLSEVMSNIVRHGNPAATWISSHWCHDPHQRWLEIRDNGGSMPERLLTVTNDRNEQADLLESGMGLGIIRQLVPDFRYLTKTTATENCFQLPIAPQTQDDKPCIAVIDDDNVQLMLIHAYLKERYRVHCFNRPDLALKKMPRLKPDLILCDVRMPGMDGLGLRRHMNQLPDLALVPFVFLTADDTANTADQASDLGVDDFLTKPLDKARLQRTVNRILIHRRTVRQQLNQRLDQSITRALFPSLPAVLEPFSCAVGARVAGSGGGDFIIHRQHGDRHTVVFGDMMGHGEQAKFFTFAYTGLIHGLLHSLDASQSPGIMLSRLSAALADHSLLNQSLMTCLILQWDTHHPVITLANAGHPDPVLLDPQHFHRIAATGPLPGLLDQADYPEQQICLHADQLLILFSDGSYEQLPGERHGFLSALEKSAQGMTEPQAHRLCAAALQRLDQQPGPLKDDATLVVIAAQKNASLTSSGVTHEHQ